MPRKFDFIPPRRQKPVPAVRPGTILQVVEDGYSYTVGVGGARIQLFTQPAKDAANNLKVGDLVMCRNVEPKSHLWYPSPQAGISLWANNYGGSHWLKGSLTGTWTEFTHTLGDSGFGDGEMVAWNGYCFGGVYYSDSVALDWGTYYTINRGTSWALHKGSFVQDRRPEIGGDGGYCLMAQYSDYVNSMVAVDSYNKLTDAWSLAVVSSDGAGYGPHQLNQFGCAMRGQYGWFVHVWPELSGGNNGRRWKIYRSVDYGASFAEVYSAWEAFSSPPGDVVDQMDCSADGNELYIPGQSAVNNDAVYIFDNGAGTLTAHPSGANASFRHLYRRSTDGYLFVGSFAALNGSRLNTFDLTTHTFSAYSPAYTLGPVDRIAFVGTTPVVGGQTAGVYNVRYSDGASWIDIIPAADSRIVAARLV